MCVLIQIKAHGDFLAILPRMMETNTSGFSADFGVRRHRSAGVNRGARFLGGCSTIALAALILVLCGCDRRAESSASAGEVRYEARGLVRGLPPDGRTIEIEHEDIRGFMPSMTMPFTARNPREIRDLRIGDAVSFRLSVSESDSFIDHIKKIALQEVHLPVSAATPDKRPVVNAPRLREGDAMPVFQLIDQTGKKISLESFRGHFFVLTFIFTRCPMPNFCPLMSKNFAELQDAIKKTPGPISQMRLLSISFDPTFDTPQILKSYAEHEQADPGIWTFATGEKSEIDDLTHTFAVYVQSEGGTISHGLTTALVDADGTVRKIWRGNGWKPAEVIQEISGGSNEDRISPTRDAGQETPNLGQQLRR